MDIETNPQEQKSVSPRSMRKILGYRVSEGSKLAAHFIVDLEGVIKGGVILGYDGDAEINVAESDGNLRIVIEIGETATQDDIRKLIPKALEYRKVLNRQQVPTDYRTRFLNYLLDLRVGGVSNERITKGLNGLLAKYLEESIDLREEYERRLMVWENMNHDCDPDDAGDLERYLRLYADLVGNPNSRYLLTINRFERILGTVFKISKDKIEKFKNTGIEQIDEGDYRHINEYPIRSLKVKDTLDYWRRSR